MRRVLWLCAVAALPAQAMWVTLTRNEAATVYIDSAAIVKVGALRRVWLVYDLREVDASGQRSVKSQVEYDCGESTYRTLSASTHSAPMGQGPVLKAMPPGLRVCLRLVRRVTTTDTRRPPAWARARP